MATKKRIVKFICPKCNATSKAFAEPEDDSNKKNKQKKECFRCGAKMTPMAEDLEKSDLAKTKPGDAENSVGENRDTQVGGSQVPGDQNEADANQPKVTQSSDMPTESDLTQSENPVEPTSLPPVQTTTHEVASENYGVVVTDTNFNVGSVEVNTIRIEDHLPAEEDHSSESRDSSKVVPGSDESESDVPASDKSSSDKSSSDEPSSDEPSSDEPSSDEPESQPTSQSEAKASPESGTQDTLKNQVVESTTSPAEQVGTTSESGSADEYKLEAITAQTTPTDNGDNTDSQSKEGESKTALEESEVDPDKHDTADTLQVNNAAADSDATAESDAKSPTQAKRLVNDPDLVAKENRLKLQYANENAWFADALHFIQSAEFVLRWLLIGLMTGLGLYLVIGAFTVASFLGYLVAIPGLVLLAVAGADICTETIAGCKKIEKWTSWEVDKILSQSLIVILSFAFAIIPGVLVSIPFILSVENYYLTTALASISFLLLFPAFMLSILDNQAISQPFSGKVFGSMKNQIVDWARFMGLSLICLLFVAGFGFFAMFGGNFLFCLIEALGIGFVALCYFRFIGFQYRKLFLTGEKKKSEND